MDLRADFLIIGSGIAALRAAAELAGAGDVLILTKAEPSEGNTGYAQGGIAAAVSADDSPELHGTDTIAAGDGLCDQQAVAALVEDGPRYVRELIEWGARFDRGVDGQPALAIEGAHSARRVLHARDATGREIGRVLWERVSVLPRVSTHSHARVVGLLLEDGRCVFVKAARAEHTAGWLRREHEVYAHLRGPFIPRLEEAGRRGKYIGTRCIIHAAKPAPDIRLVGEQVKGDGAECSPLAETCGQRKVSASRHSDCGRIHLKAGARVEVGTRYTVVGLGCFDSRDGLAKIIISRQSPADDVL